jgi:hypothetical protein
MHKTVERKVNSFLKDVYKNQEEEDKRNEVKKEILDKIFLERLNHEEHLQKQQQSEIPKIVLEA